MGKFGFREFAGQVLFALLDLSDEVELHRLPELICGLAPPAERAADALPRRLLAVGMDGRSAIPNSIA